MKAKQSAKIRKEKRMAEIYTKFREELNEDFYQIFNPSQTLDILNGNFDKIDNITIDKYVFRALNKNARENEKKLNDIFKKELIHDSLIRSQSFNKREKVAFCEMSRAQNYVQKKRRLDSLVKAFFIAPEGSLLKLQIMRKIVLTFFGYTYEGKTMSSLRKEVENKRKQKAALA